MCKELLNGEKLLLSIPSTANTWFKMLKPRFNFNEEKPEVFQVFKKALSITLEQVKAWFYSWVTASDTSGKFTICKNNLKNKWNVNVIKHLNVFAIFHLT